MDPSPGSQVADGSTVTLFFSDGPESVPDVVGKTEDQARKLIQDAGFEVSVVHDSTTEAKKGTVLDQSPQGRQQGGQGAHGDDRGLVVRAALAVALAHRRRRAPPPSPSPTPSPTPTPTPTVLTGQLAVSGRA